MRTGIDLTGRDSTIRVQDDLFGHVNGGWIASAQIPADRGRYGTFDVLREQAEAQVRDILEDVGADVPAGRHDAGSATDAAVGALYASMLDEAAVEERGDGELRTMLAEVDALQTVEDFWRHVGRLQRRGVTGALVPYVNTDDRASDEYVIYLEQSGIGLPDESYYRDPEHEAIRSAFREHVARLLALAGVASGADAVTEADTVLAVESRLADGHWDRVRTRDAVATYTKADRVELSRLAPAFPWDAWLAGLEAPAGAFDHVVVREPSYLTALSDAIDGDRSLDLASWRSWLRWQVATAYAPYLPSAYVEEDFDFYGRTLSGATQPRDRWKRATALVDTLAGEAVGKLYVERHFSPVAKDAMLELVGNLIEAYRRDISELAWMTPVTRKKALEKLAKFTPKIAYPDRWRDYSGLEFDKDDLLGNVARGHAFELDRDFAKLGGPVDRDEWFMTPQTVNAYYNPGMNEIVFPAAILQPPFFDAEADAAANYGGIGSVIGHEIGHGFDDQGSKYDGDGNLVDWWTEEDRAAFDKLAGALIAQYDGFVPRELPGEHVNGALTVGENIGDLGGLTIAYLAYRISLGDQQAPVIDGMSGDERFFYGWGQIWRMKARDAEARRLLTIDPHSPGEFRANVVRNLDEFVTTFDVQPGDDLWLEPEDRVRIW